MLYNYVVQHKSNTFFDIMYSQSDFFTISSIQLTLVSNVMKENS